jgi:hypothetical protein
VEASFMLPRGSSRGRKRVNLEGGASQVSGRIFARGAAIFLRRGGP